MPGKKEGGYYSVIPADVLFSGELSGSEKLLYALLTNLCDREGYCWASNEYLAELFKVTPISISRWVSGLEKLGFIRCEMVPTAKGSERRIYAGAFVVREGGLNKNDKTGLNKNDKGGLNNFDKTPKGNNIYINNQTVNNIPPKPPKGGEVCDGPKKAPHKSTADWKPERFERFWTYYRALKPDNHFSRQKTIKAWDRLRPDDELIARMGAALEVLRNSAEWRRGIGIPHPSTWINGYGWEDVDLDAAREADAGGEDRGVYTAEDSPYQRWSREWEREHGES